MAMEVPAPPQGVIGSVCGWLYGVFGPGNIKQDHIRTLIGEMMTVSALLSGFAIGMSAKVTDGAIRSYATFLKKEFFGKESHFCSFDVVSDLPGASSASNVALSDELERLARLHEQRLLTAEEFALAKKVALLDVGNELKAQGRPSPKKARVGEGTGRSRSPPPATDASASAGYD